jgi:phosphoglycolate phosphatase
MVKIIVFDFDGVIIDNYELHYQMCRVGIKDLSREEHRGLFDGNIHVEREKLKDRNTGYDIKKEFNEARRFMVVDDLIKRELERFACEYKLGIISSGREGGINDFLKRNGMEGLFSFVYGFESGVSKVEKFEKVFREFGVSSEDCVFVTDSVGDVKEGLEVGVKCVGVDFGYHEKERFEGSGVYRMVSSFGEIGDVVEGL